VDAPFLFLYVLVAMFGLKKFIPQLAEVIGMSDLALIERQRALARAGLLDSAEGRGPGSGVRLTADAVSTLMIAVLATASLSETVSATRSFVNAKRIEDYGKLKDALGGAETFRVALAHVLASDEEITVVRVYREAGFAVFYLRDGRPQFISKKKPSTTAFEELAQVHIYPIRALLRNAQKAAEAEATKRKNPSKSTKEKV
jgi:hypothetical protein